MSTNTILHLVVIFFILPQIWTMFVSVLPAKNKLVQLYMLAVISCTKLPTMQDFLITWILFGIVMLLFLPQAVAFYALLVVTNLHYYRALSLWKKNVLPTI